MYISIMKESFVPSYNSVEGKSFENYDEMITFMKAINTYSEIFRISNLLHSKVVFSCVELKNDEVNQVCLPGPEQLMDEVKAFSTDYSVSIIAENSEKLTNENVEQKVKTMNENLPGFFEFTYMRMTDFSQLKDPNIDIYDKIVKSSHEIEATNYFKEEFVYVEIQLTFENETDAINAAQSFPKEFFFAN